MPSPPIDILYCVYLAPDAFSCINDGSSLYFGRSNGDINCLAKTSEQFHQSIQTEQVKPSVEQIADPRLGYAKQLRDYLLRFSNRLDPINEIAQQFGSKAQVPSLDGAEAEILKNVAARRCDCLGH